MNIDGKTITGLRKLAHKQAKQIESLKAELEIASFTVRRLENREKEWRLHAAKMENAAVDFAQFAGDLAMSRSAQNRIPSP
jgi:hypothetical protein